MNMENTEEQDSHERVGMAFRHEALDNAQKA
jgi:hypothetical protein